MKTTYRTLCLASLIICLMFSLSLEVKAAERLIPPDRIKYPPLAFALPQAKKIILDNGMVMFYLRDHELPLVSVSLLVRTGSIYDPPGKEGTADLTVHTMRTGGTFKLSSEEVDGKLDSLAASPSFSMSLDAASIHFTFFKDDLDVCLDLLAQMIKEPAFEENKIKLELDLKYEELRRINDNPQKLAFREFNRLIYPDDPRGRYATHTSLQKISRQDLIDFHKRYFFSSNIMISVYGDISQKEAIDKIFHYFGNWKYTGVPLDIPAHPKQSGHGLFIIHKQLPQSTIVVGDLTISKNDPDFYAFSILDFIIGSGGFSSRIFSAVRNEEGLAYSAGSFYRGRANYGVFGAYAFTKTASTLKALQLIDSILEDIAAGSVSQNDLDRAKKSMTNGFIFSFEQPSQIPVQQMHLAYEKMPDDYLKNYRKKIEEVTLDDLKRVAALHLKGKKRLKLIVGDSNRFGHFHNERETPIFISPQP